MKYLAFVTLGIVVLGFGSILQAQSTVQNSGADQSKAANPAILAGSSSKKVGFRLTDWKTIHSHSDADAQQQIATLTKLGCEVKAQQHDGHIDIRYRCVDWKTLKVATDQLVNQWTTWCEAKGMETVVVDPPATTQKPTVRFRLIVKKTVHLHDADNADQVIGTLKMIGCQVSTNNHGNHIDATFSCPAWKTIELSSDAKAHTWQKWLDDSGFETQHTH